MFVYEKFKDMQNVLILLISNIWMLMFEKFENLQIVIIASAPFEWSYLKILRLFMCGGGLKSTCPALG